MMAPGNPNNLWSINEYNYYGLMMMPRSSPSISQQPLLISSSSSSSSSQPTADDLILPNPLQTHHGIHSSCGLLGDVDDRHDDGSRGQHRHQHDDGQKRHEDPSQLNLWRPAAREFPAVPFPDVNVSATEQQRSSPYSFVHDPDNNHHGHTAHHQHHQYCVTPSSNILSFSSNIAAADAAADECKSTASGSTCKKARVSSFSSAVQPPLKVRKEKLGGRITALHQLVSPFGKTDTASVLLEATGYIRFLEGQIKSLSAPYLGYNGSTQQPARSYLKGILVILYDCGVSLPAMGDQDEVGSPKDLRSRGLCLVPVACTHLVGSHDEMNGPDLWGSAPSGGGL